MVFSELVPRAEIGEVTSNAEELLRFNVTDVRLLNFNTCIDELDDQLRGIQFTVWSE